MVDVLSRTRFIYSLACLGAASLLLSTYSLLHRTVPARSEVGISLEIAERSVGTPSRQLQLLRSLKLNQKWTPLAVPDSLTNHSLFPRTPSTNTTSLNKSLQKGVSHNLQEGLPSSLTERFPQFMIVGFGKAGTRALYDALRLHPQLAGPQKEERFFSRKFGKGLTKYLTSFPPRPPGGYLIEKSPDYILEPKVSARIVGAAKRVGRNVGDLKFVVITRNPIDRAMSEYLEWNIQRKLAQSPQLPPFDEMVSRGGVLHAEQPFINASCYEHHIKLWLRTFAENQMCYVDGDEFVTSPLQQIQQLESCLGLQPFFTDKNFVFNSKRGFYCFQKGSDQQCMGGGKGRQHPVIAGDVRTHLEEYFKQCNSHLSQHTGFEIRY